MIYGITKETKPTKATQVCQSCKKELQVNKIRIGNIENAYKNRPVWFFYHLPCFKKELKKLGIL